VISLPQPRPHDAFVTYQGFRLFDVLVAKQELPVEVAEVDRVQVDNVNLAEPGEDEVLEELAADAASADHEHPRLPSRQYAAIARGSVESELYLLDARLQVAAEALAGVFVAAGRHVDGRVVRGVPHAKDGGQDQKYRGERLQSCWTSAVGPGRLPQSFYFRKARRASSLGTQPCTMEVK
jgi:hypothetical protein